MTRAKTYALTGVAAAGYLLLMYLFAGNSSWDRFELGWGANPLLWQHDDPAAPDGIKVYALGTLWSYLLLALLVAAGLYQARRLPAAGVDVAVPAAAAAAAGAATPGQVDDPAGWKLLMGNTYFALLWLPLRFYIGLAWLAAGEHKVKDDAWLSGAGMLRNWTNAIGTAEAAPRAYYAWYRDFLQFMLDRGWHTWFAELIAWGELLVGLGLLAGALVGVAAFCGSFMNINFMLAGSTSSNPALFGLTVLLVLAWKVAGFWGLDRWLLPALGTPWSPGRAFAHGPDQPQRQEPLPA